MRLVCVVLATIGVGVGVAFAAPPIRQELPGEPGFKVLYGRASRFCGGFEVRAIRTDAPIADLDTAPVFLLEPPPKLGLDKQPLISAKELERFSAWMVRLGSALDLVRKRADAAPDDIAAVAHTIVAERFASELLIRSAVPKSLLGGEFEIEVVDAYCDKLGEIADPILDDIGKRLATCRHLLANADPGFWDAVCAR